MSEIKPDFTANVTLYPTDQGGRSGPILPGPRYGCPCKFHPDDFSAWDCRLFIGEGPMFPGETRKVGIMFASPGAALMFRQASRFYLWEGKIIGEAAAISN